MALRKLPHYSLGLAARTADSDAALMQAIVIGDRRALRELHSRYALLLLSLAELLLSNRIEAEDLLHDVFLEAWNKAHTFDPSRGEVRRWLLMRLHSRALDRIDMCRNRRRILKVQRLVLRGARYATCDSAQDRYCAWLMRRAFLALPARQRRLLGLLYICGFSQAEVAESLACPIGTIKSRASRFLKHLADMALSRRRTFDGGSRFQPAR